MPGRPCGGRSPKISDPTCLRHVGPPWEGDIGLFCIGSVDSGPQVARFLVAECIFFDESPLSL